MSRASRMIKPESQELIPLTVDRSQRLSPHWMRVTFAGEGLDGFRPLGYDQWFRLFVPVGGDAGLERIPAKANTILGYLRFLRIGDGERPAMRSYTVRGFRAATRQAPAELDVDFVIHGSPDGGTSGPASTWALSCSPGDPVVIIDEGLAFNPERGTTGLLLCSDETGLPAIAGICASLAPDAVGIAVVEIPTAADALEFDHPANVEVRYVERSAPRVPGATALAELRALRLDSPINHAYVVGEQRLATEGRRHLVSERGMPKDAVSFCGYWRAASRDRVKA